MARKNITFNQPLEKEIGFSRAVRIDDIIAGGSSKAPPQMPQMPPGMPGMPPMM